MLKKRIVALFLMVIMLCGAMPAFAAEGEYNNYGGNLTIGDDVEIIPPFEGQTNVIENEGLEGLSSLDKWLPYGNTWQGKASVELSRIHGGNSSLKLSDTEGKKPWARQLVPVVGAATYQFTGWIWVEEEAKSMIKFEGYSAPEVNGEFATTNETIYPAVEPGKWERFSYIYIPHQNTQYVALYLRMSGAGTVLYDDVSMHMIKGPSKFSVNLNSNYYYVTENEGYATISVNDSVYKNFSDWKVDCRVLNGEEVLSEVKDISLAMGSVEFKFDVSKCDDRDATYTFEAALSEGENIATETKSVSFKRKYDRPERMGEDGIYYDENGEAFHPVTAYHLNSTLDHLNLYEEMGINVTQFAHGSVVSNPENVLKRLDWLHERGIKAMICLYYKNLIASHPDNKELVKEYIKNVKDHPAVYCWAIQDEPVLKNTDEALISEAYELVRDIDSVHPVYTIDQRAWSYPTLIRNADIIGIDNYPYGSSDAMSYIYDCTKYAVELAGKSGKPIDPLLQFFARGSGKYSQNKLYYPTGNAMRNMIYQSLMAGAKGYGFYAFDCKVDGVPVYETETGDAIREYNAKEKELMFEYFIDHKYTTFNSNYEDNPDYRYFSFVKDGAVYMVILNRHEYEETKTNIPLLSDNGLVQLGSFKAEAYAGTTEDVGGLKNLCVTLEPGAAAVYRITANNKINEEKLLQKVSLFEDLSGYSWAEEQIAALYKKGIVNMPEKGKFLPGTNITRGDFAGFLVRTLGLENRAGEQFSDVPADHPYAKEIAIGRAAGIINGVGENTYAPDKPITRQDMMTLIARGLSLDGKADLSRFSDSAKIADYAKDCVSAMISAGLINGNSDGTLNPLGNTTRAEAAVIMKRILDRK